MIRIQAHLMALFQSTGQQKGHSIGNRYLKTQSRHLSNCVYRSPRPGTSKFHQTVVDTAPPPPPAVFHPANGLVSHRPLTADSHSLPLK